MTRPPVECCMWSEADQGLTCAEPALFSVAVTYETDDGVEQCGRVPLCTLHALQASKEGIAK